MKNLVKNVVVVLLLVVSSAGVFAKEVPVKVKVAGEKSIQLFLGEITGKVWISFRDTDGNVFYSKKLKELSSYKATYDLAAFPDGEFILELSAPQQTLNVPVTITDGVVTLKEELAAAPRFSNKGSVVAVELSGKTKKAWDVMIQNPAGELIFTETVESGSTAKRKYDLSQLNSGAYILKFSTAGNSFSHEVLVKN